jgi:hypothetical protein
MNSYFKITSTLKDILQSNPDVATVIHGKTSERDLYKANRFPLAHINPVGSDFSSSQVNTFIFEIAVLEVREISKNNPIEDKFEGNDNEIDNLNKCHSIINMLLSRLRLLDNDDVELISATTATPLLLSEKNLLDVWLVQVTLQTPNNIISVC